MSSWISIDGDRNDDVVRVLAAAFADDPSIGYLCRPQRRDYADRVHRLYTALVAHHVSWGEPTWGVLDGGRLAAVAQIIRPRAASILSVDLTLAARMTGRIGVGPALRGARLLRGLSTCFPETPHVYLRCVGVIPEAQGRGYGGVLIRAAIALSERDPDSQGVALDTQKSRNVALYERFGFRVTRETVIGPLRSWCLFRPDRNPSSPNSAE